ncbi:MAG: hypothetical protein C0599_06365 [Salinivirgaceae bacterium]|nr:MAG: hypothetical protein C0599_06365 [Salinivirgaceae bacterium]
MFFVNTYQKKYPWPKQTYKEIRFWLKYYKRFRQNGKKHHTILFYPRFPDRKTVIKKILDRLNYNISSSLKLPYSKIIHWQDTTYREYDDTILTLAEKERVINFNCRDISKTKVDELHQEVFGYSTVIDPQKYEGKCVKKNILNAKHDGIILDCPINETPEEGFIYQKLIDNQYDETMVEDIRVSIIGNKIPLAILKYKPVEKRFGGFRKNQDGIKAPVVKEPGEVFSREEMENITILCQKIGLDVGEIDVLRNKNDGKIYVIDINNTPTGPSHLTEEELDFAVGKLADAFESEFLTNSKA